MVKRRLCSAVAVLCCMALLCSMAPAGASALPGPGDDGLITAVGAPDPNAVVLRTAADFSNIEEGGSYVLAGNIDFNNFNVSLLSELELVNATLDGQGHSILNLSLSGERPGLFYKISGSQVKNLVIESPKAAIQQRDAGILAGTIERRSVISNCAVRNAQFSNMIRGSGLLAYGVNDSTVQNCAVSGTMIAVTPAGGLVGQLQGDSTVTGCVSSVDISASSYGAVGGLIAWCYGGEQAISQCWADGTVDLQVHGSFNSDTGPYAGGLLGTVSNTVSLTLVNCLAAGAVSTVSEDSGVYAGGLIGYLAGDGEIRGCAATGDVSSDNSIEDGTATSTAAGGLVARIAVNHDGLTLSNCYAGGDVAVIAGSYAYVGGLFGIVEFGGKYPFTLENCSAGGIEQLTEPGWTWESAAGGLFGKMYYTTLNNGDVPVTVSGTCYYVSGDAIGLLERISFISNGTMTQVSSVPVQGMQIPGGPSDWAQQEVALALAAGLVPNGLDGHYQRSITRAEFCSLGVQLLTALGSPLTGAGGGQTFTDTSDPNVLMMSGAGIVTGHGDGTFGPDDSITRQEAAVMLGRLSRAVRRSEPNGATLSYKDLPQAADWARADIQFLSGCMDGTQRVMGGVGADLFDPYGSYTREQAILSMLRLYHFLSGGATVPAEDDDHPEVTPPTQTEENDSPFDHSESWGKTVYTYNGQPLERGRRYDLTADLRIEEEDVLELPAGAVINVDGNVELFGTLKLASDARLSCEDSFKVDGDGILDLSSGGTIKTHDFFFDSGTAHYRYLTDGIISVDGDVEIRQNFYASGSNEFQIHGGYSHEINMWNKIVQEDQYFSVFHVVDHGFEVLDVKEPFATAENGFVADDWSWLTADYGGDLLFSGSTQPSDELRGVMQAGVLLAIAREGELVKAQAGEMNYLKVDAKDFTFSYFDPDAEQVKQMTIDVSVFGLVMTGGTAVTGTVRYGGQSYMFNTDPEAAETLWNAFKNSTTIGIVKKLAEESGKDYWNVVKSLLAEMIPDWKNALEMTDFLIEVHDAIEPLTPAE